MFFMLCVISLFTMVTVSCNAPSGSPSNQEFVTFVDDYQRTVEVPTSPKRVVSTSPAVTEIIFALHADSLLIGRTDFCSYPPEAKKIPSIGGISNLNVEKIASLNPDLVISGSMIPQKCHQQLEKMGIPIACVIEKQQYEGLYENIAKIGQLVGCTRQADSLIAHMRSMMGTLGESLPTNETPRPSIYYVVGFGPSGNFTAGGNSFINDIIEMAGGHNVAADITGWSYSLEALMQADPEYIMIRREDSATFCRTKPYNQLTAVKTGKVIAIESGTIDLQVPRNLQAILYIREKLNR